MILPPSQVKDPQIDGFWLDRPFDYNTSRVCPASVRHRAGCRLQRLLRLAGCLDQSHACRRRHRVRCAEK
eukprot:5537682-Pleurochrysis_carterae.AAC.1